MRGVVRAADQSQGLQQHASGSVSRWLTPQNIICNAQSNISRKSSAHGVQDGITGLGTALHALQTNVTSVISI